MNRVSCVVVHHSASPPEVFVDAATIHRWHLERGWDGIGYHYVVLRSGKVERGRPEYWKGAHVSGHNEDTLGVCLVGSGDFTRAQVKALRSLLEDISDRHPGVGVVGHRDLDPSSKCPGLNIHALLSEM